MTEEIKIRILAESPQNGPVLLAELSDSEVEIIALKAQLDAAKMYWTENAERANAAESRAAALEAERDFKQDMSDGWMEQYDRAAVKIAALTAELDELKMDKAKPGFSHYRSRAEKAEAELAAFKAGKCPCELAPKWDKESHYDTCPVIRDKLDRGYCDRIKDLRALAARQAEALRSWLLAPWTSPTGKEGEPPCLSVDMWRYLMNGSRDALTSPPPGKPDDGDQNRIVGGGKPCYCAIGEGEAHIHVLPSDAKPDEGVRP